MPLRLLMLSFLTLNGQRTRSEEKCKTREPQLSQQHCWAPLNTVPVFVFHSKLSSSSEVIKTPQNWHVNIFWRGGKKKQTQKNCHSRVHLFKHDIYRSGWMCQNTIPTLCCCPSVVAVKAFAKVTSLLLQKGWAWQQCLLWEVWGCSRSKEVLDAAVTCPKWTAAVLKH